MNGGPGGGDTGGTEMSAGELYVSTKGGKLAEEIALWIFSVDFSEDFFVDFFKDFCLWIFYITCTTHLLQMTNQNCQSELDLNNFLEPAPSDSSNFLCCFHSPLGPLVEPSGSAVCLGPPLQKSRSRGQMSKLA